MTKEELKTMYEGTSIYWDGIEYGIPFEDFLQWIRTNPMLMAATLDFVNSEEGQ